MIVSPKKPGGTGSDNRQTLSGTVSGRRYCAGAYHKIWNCFLQKNLYGKNLKDIRNGRKGDMIYVQDSGYISNIQTCLFTLWNLIK